MFMSSVYRLFHEQDQGYDVANPKQEAFHPVAFTVSDYFVEDEARRATLHSRAHGILFLGKGYGRYFSLEGFLSCL